MAVTKLKPTTIGEFIEAAPPGLQERIRKLHKAIESAAPKAVQGLKWNMPAYSMDKILVSFAVFKNHIGLAPMQSAIKAFKKELANYRTTAGSVSFPHDQPIPLPLIKKIVKFRVKENKDGTIKWKS